MQRVSEPAAAAAGRHASAGRGLRDALSFKYVSLFTVAATYGLIVLGGVVRSTNSGTACPDWPLCKGEIVPPFETKVMIEYTHRVVASLVGLLILGVVLWAWRNRSEDSFSARTGVVALVLLIAQVVMGGVTVNTETNSGIVAIHLSIALGLLTTLIVLASAAFVERPIDRFPFGRVSGLAIAAVGAVFGLIIAGAFVSQEAAGLAYPDWPLFDGKLGWAASKAGELHYVHRVVAVIAGVALGALVVRTLRAERDPLVLWAITGAFTLYVVQVFVGASNIWLDLATTLRILHLALASLLWAVLMFGIIWSQLRDAKARGEAMAG